MHLATELLKGIAVLWAVLFVVGCVIAAFTARTIFQELKAQKDPQPRGAKIINFPKAAQKRPDKTASSR